VHGPQLGVLPQHFNLVLSDFRNDQPASSYRAVAELHMVGDSQTLSATLNIPNSATGSPQSVPLSDTVMNKSGLLRAPVNCDSVSAVQMAEGTGGRFRVLARASMGIWSIIKLCGLSCASS
jgi:hypothetical protein